MDTFLVQQSGSSCYAGSRGTERQKRESVGSLSAAIRGRKTSTKRDRKRLRWGQSKGTRLTVHGCLAKAKSLIIVWLQLNNCEYKSSPSATANANANATLSAVSRVRVIFGPAGAAANLQPSARRVGPFVSPAAFAGTSSTRTPTPTRLRLRVRLSLLVGHKTNTFSLLNCECDRAVLCAAFNLLAHKKKETEKGAANFEADPTMAIASQVASRCVLNSCLNISLLFKLCHSALSDSIIINSQFGLHSAD